MLPEEKFLKEELALFRKYKQRYESKIDLFNRHYFVPSGGEVFTRRGSQVEDAYKLDPKGYYLANKYILSGQIKICSFLR